MKGLENGAGAQQRRGVSWGYRLATLGVVGAMGFALATPAMADAGGPKIPTDHPVPAAPHGTENGIVEYQNSTAAALELVQRVLPPGAAKSAFTSIDGVEITIPSGLVSKLTSAGATFMPDSTVNLQTTSSASCPSFSGTSAPTGQFVQDSGANQLANAGDTGRGVTVAVLDSGIQGNLPDFSKKQEIDGVTLAGGGSPWSDQYGHGTFVAGLIAGNGASSNGQYQGEAPGVNLVSIKVAGADGTTSMSTIIQGIDWAISHQKKDNISVLNMSLGMIPTGPTATEPLDQAVEAAWNAGITVVVAAGNSGPFNGTILSPGDDPLAITVGAYADNNSPSPANWAACPFSSAGPTLFDGWMKPDLVAPGRSVVSLYDPGSTIAKANPASVIGTGNFVGSGTSFSTAITSGAAALVLADNPGITPNEVKGRLLGDATPGELGNPYVEGHGFLNAYTAATGPSLVYNQSAAAAAESTVPASSIDLGSAWAPSSWNPANYTGEGVGGTGASWNGSAWTGSAWTGSAWTGSAWTGSAWTNGVWNGSAWTGASWNGSAWTGSAWTGSAWTGSAWTGSAWTGSAWTGSAWTGSAWTGSAWTGSAWTGSAWTGSAWTGSAWTGSAWTGSAWTGSAWTGSAWTGSAWT